ncbi:hypothetical protein [Fimbriiglobus ruber]|uniref:hypothetical protein n=1 Tax=Fimbriiglobus ruber TaxID=1908690 RepID=UPI001EE74394|nr:hypothetical protein [Fimbriiglobus ruber]
MRKTTRQLTLCASLLVCVAAEGCADQVHRQPDEKCCECTPENVRLLIEKINDDINLNHADHTQATDKLIDCDDIVLEPAVELMLSPDEETRCHAATVLVGVTYRQYGWVPGRGWSQPDDYDKWIAFWRSLGNLNYEADEMARRHSVELWRKWLANRNKV